MTLYRGPTVFEIGMQVLGHYLVRSSVRSFAHIAHSFAFSALPTTLARSAVVPRSLSPELAGQKPS